jgi:hypothetical protein
LSTNPPWSPEKASRPSRQKAGLTPYICLTGLALGIERVEGKLEIGRRRIISGSAEIAAIRAIAALDQRPRKHACRDPGISPSCVFHTPQLKRE